MNCVDLFHKFVDVFSSIPGLAKVNGHSINLSPNFVLKKMRPCCIPIVLQEVGKQVHELLRLGLIKPNDSEWAHPILCVS